MTAPYGKRSPPPMDGVATFLRGLGLRYPHSLGETQHKRCFTPVFCEAVDITPVEPVHEAKAISC